MRCKQAAWVPPGLSMRSWFASSVQVACFHGQLAGLLSCHGCCKSGHPDDYAAMGLSLSWGHGGSGSNDCLDLELSH